VKVELRALGFIGPDSIQGRKALLAAAEQNRAFNFAEILYFNQRTENTGWLNDTMIAQAAASIPGMQVHELLNARSAGSVADKAKTFDGQAAADKVTGTPTLYVGRTGSKGTRVKMASSTDQQALVDAISAALP
jgi:protein-disulfide isomerase